MPTEASTIPSFRPPADLDDFDEDGRKEWSKTVNDWFVQEITAKDMGWYRHPLQQFFNPTVTSFDQSLPPVPITWIGFPLKVRISQPTDDARWAWAESPKANIAPPTAQLAPNKPERWMMDEYCEWSTKKDPETKDVLIASFTCEGPEYWQQLAKMYSLEKILGIYKELNPDFAHLMTVDDLKGDDGKYNIFNKWNRDVDTGTIAHLIQENNSLSAEIDIAAQATVARKDLLYSERITNMITLCGDASSYGNPQRNSDPTIGSAVNEIARLGVGVSVMDPVALYMHDADFSSIMLDPTGLRRGNTEDMVPVPDGTFTWMRGDISQGMGLHLKVRLPKGTMTSDGSRELNCSDLFDLNNGGQYIRYGSQFADYITMSVSGVVGPAPQNVPMQYALTYTEPLVIPPFLAPGEHLDVAGALNVSQTAHHVLKAGTADVHTDRMNKTGLSDVNLAKKVTGELTNAPMAIMSVPPNAGKLSGPDYIRIKTKRVHD